MVTIEKDDLSVRVKVNGDKMYYCLYDITKNLGIGSKGGNSIKEAIERAFKRKLSKSKIGKDDFSFIDDEQLEYFLRCYSTSAELNAFLREIPYRYKSYMAKQEIAKESQKPKAEVEVPSVVDKSETKKSETKTEVQNLNKEDVKVFSFDSFNIETIFKDGEPFFRLRDIVGILDISRTTASNWIANKWFDDDEVVDVINYDIGGHPLKYVAESGLYRILNRTNSPKARPFERWVTKEVLPSIRKTGSYQVEQKPAIPQTYAEALLEAGRLALENEKLQAQAIENAPKVVAYDKLMDTHNNISIKEFGKIIGIGEKNLFRWLRDNSYLMADNKPYQRYIDRDYFEVVEKTCNIDENRNKSYTQTLITPKGQGYLSNKIKN